MPAVVTTKWIMDGMGGSVGAQVTRQSESCIIVFDSAVESVPEAIKLSGFYEGQPHRTLDFLSVLGEVEAEPLESGHEWRFNLEYSSEGTTANFSFDDDEYRPKIIPGRWTYQDTVMVDKETGEPIENPAGDPYPPEPIEVSAIKYRIIMREGSANMGRIPLVGSVNNAAITILGIPCPKYCVQLSDFLPVPHLDDEGNLTFFNEFEVKFCFKKNRQGDIIGFKSERLANGFNELITASDKTSGTKPIMENNEPVAEPKKLGEDGKLTTTPYYQENIKFDLINFSQFGLPANYPVF